MTNDNTRFIRFAILICIIALIAGLALGAMAAQIHDAQSIRYELEATFEAQFDMEVGQ